MPQALEFPDSSDDKLKLILRYVHGTEQRIEVMEGEVSDMNAGMTELSRRIDHMDQTVIKLGVIVTGPHGGDGVAGDVKLLRTRQEHIRDGMAELKSDFRDIKQLVEEVRREQRSLRTAGLEEKVIELKELQREKTEALKEQRKEDVDDLKEKRKEERDDTKWIWGTVLGAIAVVLTIAQWLASFFFPKS